MAKKLTILVFTTPKKTPRTYGDSHYTAGLPFKSHVLDNEVTNKQIVAEWREGKLGSSPHALAEGLILEMSCFCMLRWVSTKPLSTNLVVVYRGTSEITLVIFVGYYTADVIDLNLYLLEYYCRANAALIRSYKVRIVRLSSC